VTHALLSVSVVAPRCARADGLATALLALGPEEGPALADREALVALFLIADGEGGIVERPTTGFIALGGSFGTE
jgi:thiamine biosynthesis lipoprotein